MEIDELIQDTLSDNIEVFERIKSELKNARRDIHIAMSWFTDQELFDVLIDKAKENVEISLILSDQPDNNRLDFGALQRLGAKVIKVKNVGWGMMHQKFCIIDRELVIAGSYNWSVNARNNNHESVIVTNLPKTVSDYLAIFENIKERAHLIANADPEKEPITLQPERDEKAITHIERTPKRKLNFEEESIVEFKNVLDNIFDSEVANFDQEMVKNIGYIRSKNNNGDQQIIPQAMDSLYHNFINDVDVIEEKKRRLHSKIQEQQKLVISTFEINSECEINSRKESARILTETNQINVSKYRTDIDILENEIRQLRDIKIPYTDSEISSFNSKIAQKKIESIQPPNNRKMLILCCIMTVFLIAYIFVFYSSVAYIFIFSQQDVNEQLARSVSIETPDVFNPHALTKMWSKGIGGIMFLFLFVFIPLSLGMIQFFNDKKEENSDETPQISFFGKITKWLNSNKGIILIIVVDVFIAYKVSKNINKIEYLTNKTDRELQALDLLTTDNFWLVFILGTLGVYLFEKVITKLFQIFDQRNPTLQQIKGEIQIGEYEGIIEDKKKDRNNFELKDNELNTLLIQKRSEKKDKEFTIQQIALKLNEDLVAINQSVARFKERVLNLSNIYISRIDNDKITISIDALHDRINIFFEGWSKYLHEEFSKNIAEKKTLEAIDEIARWKELKSIKHKEI